MVPVTLRFRLLKLPFLALKVVLRTMDTFDLISFSLCSRKLRLLTQRTFINPGIIRIHLYNDKIELVVENLSYYRVELSPDSPESPLTLRAITGQYQHRYSFDKPPQTIQNGFDARQWINHFMRAFKCGGIHLNISCGKYDLEDVQRMVEGKEIHELSVLHVPNDYLMRVLEAFQPSKGLYLFNRGSRSIANILSRNYHHLHLNYPVSLEDTMSLNSKYVSLASITDVYFNKILHRWINGGNPNLVEMVLGLTLTHRAYVTVVFDGIQYKKLEDEGLTVEVYEIRNEQGTTAAIQFERRFGNTLNTAMVCGNNSNLI